MEEEDTEEVFTVELHRGPHGLGLALVDGTVGPRLPRWVAAAQSRHVTVLNSPLPVSPSCRKRS